MNNGDPTSNEAYDSTEKSLNRISKEMKNAVLCVKFCIYWYFVGHILITNIHSLSREFIKHLAQ